MSVDDADAPPKRRVAVMNEIPEEAHGLVRQLVDQRLLVSDVREGETTVEVSHEVVLRHWKGLRVWIDEDRSALRTLDAVQTAAKDWQRKGSEQGGDTWLVHRGERLAEAEKLLGRSDYRRLLGDSGHGYLVACRRQERKDLQRQRRLQRRVAFALLLVALAIAGFAAYAVNQARKASAEVSLVLSDYARRAIEEGRPERGARLAALAAREGPLDIADPAAYPTLAAAAQRSNLVMDFPAHQGGV